MMSRKRVIELEVRRREMDEALLGFRVGRRVSVGVKGWLRAVRQTVGIPVKEVAARLGVTEWEVLRLEQAEIDARIKLESLRKAAKGLHCELVYAIVPVKGSLEDMAQGQKAVRDEARAERRRAAMEKRIADRKPWLEMIGWRPAILDALRTALRREGVRVRPRKTDRGDAAAKETFDVVMKLAALKVSAKDLERQEEGNRE